MKNLAFHFLQVFLSNRCMFFLCSELRNLKIFIREQPTRESNILQFQFITTSRSNPAENNWQIWAELTCKIHYPLLSISESLQITYSKSKMLYQNSWVSWVMVSWVMAELTCKIHYPLLSISESLQITYSKSKMLYQNSWVSWVKNLKV